MNKLTTIDWVALVLVIVGGLNWGLAVFNGFNLVTALVGTWPVLETIVYGLVGISALYVAVISPKLSKQ